MKDKFINFDWIINDLIVHNLLISYLNLTEAWTFNTNLNQITIPS